MALNANLKQTDTGTGKKKGKSLKDLGWGDVGTLSTTYEDKTKPTTTQAVGSGLSQNDYQRVNTEMVNNRIASLDKEIQTAYKQLNTLQNAGRNATLYNVGDSFIETNNKAITNKQQEIEHLETERANLQGIQQKAIESRNAQLMSDYSAGKNTQEVQASLLPAGLGPISTQFAQSKGITPQNANKYGEMLRNISAPMQNKRNAATEEEAYEIYRQMEIEQDPQKKQRLYERYVSLLKQVENNQGGNVGRLFGKSALTGVSQITTGAANVGAAAEVIAAAPINLIGKALGEEQLIDPSNGAFHQLAEGNRELQEKIRREQMTEIERLGGNKGWEIAGNLISGTVAALPMAISAYFLGGATLGAQFVGDTLSVPTTNILEEASQILTNYVHNPQYWSSFAQEAGSNYQEALENGATESQAIAVALLSGVINGAIEIGLEGVSGIQGIGQNGEMSVKEFLDDVVLQEGGEEIVQGMFSRAAQKIIYDQKMRTFGSGGVFDPLESLEEGLMGAAVGGILGGGNLIVNAILTGSGEQRVNSLGKNIRSDAEIMSNLAQYGLSLEQGTTDYETAVKLRNNVPVTNEELGSLYANFTQSYTTQRDGFIKEAIRDRLTQLGETDVDTQIDEIMKQLRTGKATELSDIAEQVYAELTDLRNNRQMKFTAYTTPEWVQSLQAQLNELQTRFTSDDNLRIRQQQQMQEALDQAKLRPRSPVQQKYAMSEMEKSIEQAKNPQLPERTNINALPTAEEADRNRRWAKAKTDTARSGILAGASNSMIKQAERLSKWFGTDVRFFRGPVARDGFHEGGTIYINAAGKNVLASIVTHEITHKLESTGAYQAFQDTVLKLISDGTDLQQLIQDKIDTYAKYGETIDEDGAKRELVAEYVQKNMLSDMATIRKFVRANRQGAINFRQRIGDMLNRMTGAEAQEKSLLEKAYDLYGQALRESKTTEKDNVEWSLANDSQYMDAAMAANKIVPKSVMDRARKARQTVADVFNDPEVKDSLGLPPDIIGDTYIPNGSYDGTEENTTVCVRSMAVDALMDAVAEELGRPLTVEDTIAISQEYWKYTDKPECKYCYVAMDRKSYREFMGSYLQQREDVIENLKNGMPTEEAYTEFLDGRKNTKNMRARFDMFKSLYESGANMIQPADLASEAAMQRAIKNDPTLEKQINDAREYAQKASWAKKRISYAAYDNHILKWTQNRINNLNSHYGLRLYSFSDYSPAFILENMQMVTDAAVRGLKILAYTKELDFVKIFAPTGMNINISVFGYQQNGMIAQDGMQGADWKQAQDLRDQYDNVGITFVATNDALVEWALDQDWIDVVIPFHLVRTGAKVASYFGWTNYSGMQADIKAKEWSKGDKKSIYPSEHQNSKAKYLAELKENHLRPRFEKWIDNPNYMKLVNETRRSAGKTPAVRPIFNTAAALESIETMRKQGGYYVPIGGSEEEMRYMAGEIAENIRGQGRQWEISEDEIEQNIRAAYRMDPVAELTGNEFEKGPIDLITQVTDYYKSIGGVVFSDLLGEIAIDKRGVKDDIAHGVGRIKAAAFHAVPEVIENGKIIDYQYNWKNRGYDTYVFCAPITIKGERYYEGVIVNRSQDDNRLYLHEVLTEKEGSSPFKTGTAIKSGAPGGESPSLLNLLEKVRNVKREMQIGSAQITTDNFKKWFGDWQNDPAHASEVVDKDGKPLIVYHQTNTEHISIFDNSNPAAAKYDSETPNGYFFKTNDHDIGLDGKNQFAYFLNARNLLNFANRKQANAWYSRNIDGYAALQNEMNSKIKPIDDLMNEIENKMFAADVTDEQYEQFDKEWNDLLKEMSEIENDYRGRLREMLNQYFLNGNSKYDGIHLKDDGHRYVNGKRENVETYIVFDQKQIKSATDNIGTFNKNDPRTEWSITPEQDAEYLELAKDPEGNKAKLDSMVKQAARATGYSSSILYHLSDSNSIRVFQSGNSAGIIYFASSPDAAKRGARGKKYTYAAYLNVRNPVNSRNTAINWYDAEDSLKVAEWKRQGYDGVYVKDESGISLAVFEPSQIKSADPVTYDDSGNVIPLSERFNSENEDIRWSITPEEKQSRIEELKEYLRGEKQARQLSWQQDKAKQFTNLMTYGDTQATKIIDRAHNQGMSVDEYLRANTEMYDRDGRYNEDARRALELERRQYSITEDPDMDEKMELLSDVEKLGDDISDEEFQDIMQRAENVGYRQWDIENETLPQDELLDAVTNGEIDLDSTKRQMQRDTSEVWDKWIEQANPIGTNPEDLISTGTNKQRRSAGETAREAWSYFKRKMVDSGEAVTRIGKAVQDPHLYHYYNMARASTNAAISMIENDATDIYGNKTGDGLNKVFENVRSKGDEYYKLFQLYMFHMHNIDRMSRFMEGNLEYAQAAFEGFRAENPELLHYTDEQIANMAKDQNSDLYYEAKEYMQLLRDIKDANVQNKPVFGYDVTADDSRNEVDRLLREHPEFADEAEKVYAYIDNLLRYRVDSGLITEEEYGNLKRLYPHYVPTFRDFSRDNTSRRNRNSVQVGTTIKTAVGGDQRLMPLHKSLAQQTMSVVREGSKNRFGARLLNSGAQRSAPQHIRSVEEYQSDFSSDAYATATEQQDMRPQKENTFIVIDGGKKYQMTVSSALFEAVKALSPDAEEKNIAIRAIRAANDLFKELVTGYNPVFLVRNFIRDQQDAWLYSKDTKRYLAQYPQAVKEIASNGKYWQRYKALGGTYSSIFDYETGETNRGGKLKRNTVGRIEALNMAVEQAPRLAEFMATVKAAEKAHGEATMDDLMDAMYNAADVTVNFGRSGTLGKKLNANFVPFLNPGIQGFDKMVRRITETKGWKSWASLIVKATILGIAPALLNGLIYKDDDEWDKLKDRDKDIYYLFKIGDHKWLKVPKGRTLSLLGMGADRINDLFHGEDVEWGEVISTAASQVAPANPLENNILNAWIGTKLFDKDNPGTTWYGSDIESQRLRNYAPGERYDASTDVFSKWLGGKLNLSPVKINYLLDSYTGVVGDVLLPLMASQERKGMFEKAFTVDTTKSNRYSTDFYEKSDELTYAKNTPNATGADTLIDRYWNKQANAVSEINKVIREIESSSDLSNKQKQQISEIQYILRNNIMAAALNNLDAYSEAVRKYYDEFAGLDESDRIDAAYREANREVLGAEYALSTYDKTVYNTAAGMHSDTDLSYDDFYDFYFDRKEIERNKTGYEKTNAVRSLIHDGDYTDAQKDALYEKYVSDADGKQDIILATRRAGLGFDDFLEADIRNAEIDNTLSGYEKTNAMRDYIRESEYTEEQKRVLYESYVSKTESNADKIDTFKAAGLDMDEFLKVQNEYNMLDKTVSGAGNKATELARWLNSQKYSDSQKSVIKDAFKYYNQIPAEAKRYDELVAAGISDDKAYNLNKALNALEPLPGADEVSNLQKWETVTKSNLTATEQITALQQLMGDSDARKVKIAYDYGIEPQFYVQLKKIMPDYDADKNGNYTNAEITNAINSMTFGNAGGGILLPTAGTNSMRAALWQLQTGSTSAKNNPYSTSIGNQVIAAVQSAKEAEKSQVTNAAITSGTGVSSGGGGSLREMFSTNATQQTTPATSNTTRSLREMFGG